MLGTMRNKVTVELGIGQSYVAKDAVEAEALRFLEG